MSQAMLFELAEPDVSPALPLDERYRLWIARQSGIYCEVLDEIEREIKGGRTPVSIPAVFQVLADQPDLAKSFSRRSGFDAAFAAPMLDMMVGFGDVDREQVCTEATS